MGLSMSPSWEVAEDQLGVGAADAGKDGRVTTQSGWMGSASSISWSPNGRAANFSSSSSEGTSHGSSGSGRTPNRRAFEAVLAGGVGHGPHAGHESVDARVFISTTAFMSGTWCSKRSLVMAATIPTAPSSGGASGPEYGAGSLPGWSQISVSNGPGITSLTVTPVPDRSMARDSLHPARANLEAL